MSQLRSSVRLHIETTLSAGSALVFYGHVTSFSKFPSNSMSQEYFLTGTIRKSRKFEGCLTTGYIKYRSTSRHLLKT